MERERERERDYALSELSPPRSGPSGAGRACSAARGDNRVAIKNSNNSNNNSDNDNNNDNDNTNDTTTTNDNNNDHNNHVTKHMWFLSSLRLIYIIHVTNENE